CSSATASARRPPSDPRPLHDGVEPAVPDRNLRRADAPQHHRRADVDRADVQRREPEPRRVRPLPAPLRRRRPDPRDLHDDRRGRRDRRRTGAAAGHLPQHRHDVRRRLQPAQGLTTMIEHAYLIPLIPAAASFIILFGAKEDPHSPLPWIGIRAMAASILWGFAACTVALPYEQNWTWFSFATTIGGSSFVYPMSAGVLIDPSSALVLFAVTLVSLMVQVYSISYMHDDKRYKR